MSSFKLLAYLPNDSLAGVLTVPVALTLTKERYTPFFTLDFTFLASSQQSIPVGDTVSVRLMYGSTGIFFGRAASLKLTEQSGSRLYTGRAFGFTKTLGTSDAVPGMIFDCTLSSLAQANVIMPNVNYQQVSDEAPYIYVKESDTIWSAIAALSIKLYENYPYTVGENTVYIKKTGQAEIDYSNERITEMSSGISFANAVSKIYMQGTEGTYEFSATDREAVRRGIIRERYIPLDRQWLSSPETGLKHKMYFARRGGIYRSFTYQGFKNEQLCDTVSFSCGEEQYTGEVSKLILRADRRGIFTTITSYDDGYSQITQGE